MTAPEQDPTDARFAGLLFDFGGFLTSRDERLTVSARDNATPMVDAIVAFAAKRELPLEACDVKNWRGATAPAPTEQPADRPIGWCAVAISKRSGQIHRKSKIEPSEHHAGLVAKQWTAEHHPDLFDIKAIPVFTHPQPATWGVDASRPALGRSEIAATVDGEPVAWVASERESAVVHMAVNSPKSMVLGHGELPPDQQWTKAERCNSASVEALAELVAALDAKGVITNAIRLNDFYRVMRALEAARAVLSGSPAPTVEDAQTRAYADGRGEQYAEDCAVVHLLLENCDDADAESDGRMNTTRIRELLSHFVATRSPAPEVAPLEAAAALASSPVAPSSEPSEPSALAEIRALVQRWQQTDGMMPSTTLNAIAAVLAASGQAEAPLPTYVYEWDGPFGLHQSLSSNAWNGRRPDRTLTLYPAPQAPAQPAIARFRELEADPDTDLATETPLERLRFFCSLALQPQDWLDVEPFFDALAAPAQPVAAEPVGTVAQALTPEVRAILEAVRRELDEGDGNAPGHAHTKVGIWDDDNGDLAGKPCAWCLSWKHFTGRGIL